MECLEHFFKQSKVVVVKSFSVQNVTESMPELSDSGLGMSWKFHIYIYIYIYNIYMYIHLHMYVCI